jgi:hypothetical protein
MISVWIYQHRIPEILNLSNRNKHQVTSIKVIDHIDYKIDKITHYRQWKLEKMGNITVLNIMILKAMEFIINDKIIIIKLQFLISIWLSHRVSTLMVVYQVQQNIDINK